MAQKLKIKTPSSEGYDPHVCGIVKCKHPTEVIDGTGRLTKLLLPLCKKHWEEWCK